MKALILAAGRGSRVNEISESINKCMIAVGDKPAIQYSLDNAIQMNVDEIVIIIGYHAEDIINHYGNNYQGKRIRYVIQDTQRGLVHAMECAKGALEGADFILMLGDEIPIQADHAGMVKTFRDEGAFALCGVLNVEDRDYIRRTYTLFHGQDNRIFRLIEKPRNPTSSIMGTGNCLFKNEILDYIEMTPIHYQRKEKELPDLIQCAVDDGKLVKMFHLCAHYVNLNSMDDVRLAVKLLGGRP